MKIGQGSEKYKLKDNPRPTVIQPVFTYYPASFWTPLPLLPVSNFFSKTAHFPFPIAFYLFLFNRAP